MRGGRLNIRPSLVKRSPKMMANWVLAIAHSRGGMVHSFSALFKTGNRSFLAFRGLDGCRRRGGPHWRDRRTGSPLARPGANSGRCQQVLDAAFLSAFMTRSQNFAPFVLLEPEPEDLLRAVGADAERDVDRVRHWARTNGASMAQ